MKKTNIFILAGLTVAMAIPVTSCKKLDLFPYSQIAVAQSFKTINDAQAYDVGVMSQFRARQYGTYMYYADVQGDQLNAALDYGNRSGSPARWDGTFTADDQTLGPIWQGYYANMADVNTAIAGYPSIPTNGAADVSALNQYMGDAYLARAYYYHRLILRWAKPYEPATAATDLGVPLVLVYDLNGAPARATVQAVYNQIIADITKAESLLAATPGVQGSKYFTIDAAVALEARVRLDMHDYAGAYTAAQSLITGGKYPLITTQAAFTAYWTTDGVQESITQMAANSSELPNTNAIYLGYQAATAKYDPDWIPSQWVVNMFTGSGTDIRLGTYFLKTTVIIQGVSTANIYLVNKYPGNPALFTGATTNYENAPKVFRISEMYLIAAEAAESLSTPNEPNAIADLNALRVARGELATVGLTGATLVQAIRDERFRELAFEGFRLNDLKRWHLGFTRNTPQNANLLVQGTQYYTLSIPADAPKFVWGIPSNDMIINPNLVQNPGW